MTCPNLLIIDISEGADRFDIWLLSAWDGQRWLLIFGPRLVSLKNKLYRSVIFSVMGENPKTDVVIEVVRYVPVKSGSERARRYAHQHPCRAVPSQNAAMPDSLPQRYAVVQHNLVLL